MSKKDKMISKHLRPSVDLILFGLLATALSAATVWGAAGNAVQDRLDSDIRAGRPIIVHVVVALCDNVNQGIVPVPDALGNGQNPNTNLYWGALYGVRTYCARTAGWQTIESVKPDDKRILDRVILFSSLKRAGQRVPVYIIADAWNGAEIKAALSSFLRISAGRSAEVISIEHNSTRRELHAGGSAQLVAFVGHNGLMDFSLELTLQVSPQSIPRSAIVLACASKPFFLEPLEAVAAHPLVLTTGLMAPEAYILDAAIRSWIESGTTTSVVEAAAAAYNKYQQCGLNAARKLFWGKP